MKSRAKGLFTGTEILYLGCEIVTDWPVLLLIMEGIPFLAFVYYLEHKKKMYLLERGNAERAKEESLDLRLERRLSSGLFLSLTGMSLLVSPNLAGMAGIETNLTFELLVMGIVVLCSGLAMLLGYGIMKGKKLYSTSDGILEFK
ncbi:MAG: Uncharacterized protein XD72_1699 [Methanothrix harundinacea]|uniref:Uncharacterized protein n=1 Tax=Methanothrix harundinacea TaxID=301375 RepID=A0A117LF89_9EURY|nr:MAG: Uncharacterized protein XD72_1699 [Methanothrix harundinacea]